MKNSVIGRATYFLKKHIFIIVYFLFFVLASLPTITGSFGKVETLYKIGVLLLLAVSLFVIILKRRIKLNIKPIIFVVSIFIIYSLYYLILPKYHSFIAPSYSFIEGTTITVSIDFSMKISSIINVFNICFFILLFMFVAPSLELTKKNFLVFNVLFLFFMLISCLFSVKDLLNGSWSKNGLESFFQNKNTFGFFLMISVFLSFLSSTFVKKIYAKMIFYILGVVFFAFTLLSKSSTAAILSAFLIIASIFYFVSDSTFLSKLMKIVIYSLVIASVAVVAISPWIPFLSSTILGEYVKGIYDKIANIGKGGIETLFTSRGKMWMLGAYFIPSKFIFLGYGIPLLERMTYLSNVSYFTTSVLTNSYLTILDGFGIVGALFYLGLFIFLFIVYFKDNSKLSEWILLLFIAYLAYGMFESLVLFRSGMNSLILTPILIVPAMTMVKNHFQIGFLKIKVIANEQK